MNKFDVVVIGQGYAGLLAAKRAREQGLKVASVEALYPGGLVMNIMHLDPAPEGVTEPNGSDVISTLAMDNMDLGIPTIAGSATAVIKSPIGHFTVETDSEAVEARQVIVASGAKFRKLGVPGEEEFFGRGISECADCDGPMFGGMDAVIVGGGDSAFQEAAVLSQFAKKVTIVMRGQKPRARAKFVEVVQAIPNIDVLQQTEVTAIEGTVQQGVTGVRLRTGDGAESTHTCSGVFVFIGLKPNADFLPESIDRDDAGGVMVSHAGETSIPGIWAVGAVRSGYGGLLADAEQDVERTLAAIAS